MMRLAWHFLCWLWAQKKAEYGSGDTVMAGTMQVQMSLMITLAIGLGFWDAAALPVLMFYQGQKV